MEECVTQFLPLHAELDQSRVDLSAIKKIAAAVASIHKATYGQERITDLMTDFGYCNSLLNVYFLD